MASRLISRSAELLLVRSQRWRNPSSVFLRASRSYSLPACQAHFQIAPMFALSSSSFSSAAPETKDGVENGISSVNGSASNPVESKPIEELYSKKTPLEHVLLRPGMYIGPVERLPPTRFWVVSPVPDPWIKKPPETLENVPVNGEHSGPILNSTRVNGSASQDSPLGEQDRLGMVQRDFGIIPGLIKVFDEILVNASDNRLRHPESCSRLDVLIDPGSEDRDPFIQIRNDGKGIPVQFHREENIYVPELLFGHLLTGSNFDDNEKRLTGGRHGYGAKLTNIFSKSFTVETLDSSQKLKYSQTWHDNMAVVNEAQISSVEDARESDDYTCVSFVPDMPRLTSLSSQRFIPEEDYALMCRRVVDIAGCAAGDLKVTLNGKDVSMKSFAEYTAMYRKPEAPDVLSIELNPRWSIGVGLSENNTFESISFVNGMATPRGGTHVNAIVNQVVKRIQEKVAKIDKLLSSTITLGLVRRNLFISCNTLIENPSFDSQMKEFLTSSPANFGSSCELPESFLKKIVQSADEGGPGIIEEVIRVAEGRQQANLLKDIGGKKNRRQLLSIPKLEDAHRAGTQEDGIDCSLILTEGDSAKALAVAGLEVIGRKLYGVFPLRGKFLNVRHATVDQLAKNKEVKALISIIGLDFDEEYSTVEERKSLRYGHVMLMTDQDTDGAHIKGLVINFFRHFWPKLLMPPTDQPESRPFLSSFVTPLLKVSKKSGKESHSFFSQAEYNVWRDSLPNPEELRRWKVKYYKGLGTSSPAEAKEYFSAFDKHHRPFVWGSETDGELLDKVFDKTRASDRRDWIKEEYDEEAAVVVDPELDNSISFEDFVNKEMIHFSNADNIRSLPHVIDGLKPSQRKVLFACFKRSLTSEMKVAQLSGYCAEHTAYHHGEASLQSTIISMAQDFVGSNNINLLVPNGQFGTRLEGGKDAASPRYIFTHLSPLARLLFPEEDDPLLQYLEDDGQSIEPKHFCPVIPLLLVNGAQGIGTGWSTSIPPHNPISVVDYIRAKLENWDVYPTIEPYARGFTGEILTTDDRSKYVSFGKIRMKNGTTVVIDELPIGTWTNAYKGRLLRMREKNMITDFIENHTTTKVRFEVKSRPLQMNKMSTSGLEKSFGLCSNLNLTNMNAFDGDGSIQKFNSAEEIADTFYPVRLSLYHDRKSVMISEFRYSAAMLRSKARFIKSISAGEIDLARGRLSKEETVNLLRELGFSSAQELDAKRRDNSIARSKLGDDEEKGDTADSDNEFDYLLRMPLSSLTSERIAKLEDEASRTEIKLNEIETVTPEELWLTDLEKLAAGL